MKQIRTMDKISFNTGSKQLAKFKKEKISMERIYPFGIWNFSLLILLLVSTFSLQAQDYKEDFEKAAAIFQEEVYELKMEYLFFPSYTATEAIERETIHMQKEGERFRLNQFGLEVIYDEKYILLIDAESRIIAIDKKRDTPNATKTDNTAALEALEGVVGKLAVKMGWDTLNTEPVYQTSAGEVKNGEKSYSYTYDYGVYEKFVLYIDAKTGLASKQVLYYREPIEIEEDRFSKVRVEINFLKQKVNPVFDEDTFNVVNYLTIQSDGTAQALGKYRDFVLINHLEQNAYKY